MTESQLSGASPQTPRKPRALLRRLLLGLAAGAALLVAIVLSLRVPAIGTAVANLVLGRIPVLPGAALSVRRAHGDWLTHVELRGLRLMGAGVTYVAADTLRARFSLWPLLSGQLHIASAEITGVIVDPRTFSVPRPPRARPPRRLTLDDFLHGRFYQGPRLAVGRLTVRDVRGAGMAGEASLLAGVADSTVRVMSVRLEAHDIALGGDFAFALDTLGLRLRPARGEREGVVVNTRASLRSGRLELNELRLDSPSSNVRARGELAYAAADSLPQVWLSLDAVPLDLADLSAFVRAPSPGAASFEGLLRAKVDLAGRSLDSVSGKLQAEMKRGEVAGLRVAPLQIAAVLDRGRAEVVLDAGVEGAPVAVRGWVRPLDSHATYALRATTPRLPARLPGAPWWTDLAGRAPFAIELSIKGHGFADMVADIEGAARGEAGALKLQGRLDLSRGFGWEVTRLALDDLDVARVAGNTADSRVKVVLRGRGEIGPRGQQRVWARVDLDTSSYGRWTVSSGRALATLGDQGGAASLRLESAGGSLSVDTLTWRLDGGSPFRLRGGRVSIGDLAAFTGDAALAGRIEARAELEGSGLASLGASKGAALALRQGRVRARGQLLVEPSSFRGRTVQGGKFELALARGELTLQGGLESDAGRLASEASSRPFDDVPSHRLRRLRFDALDLGAWLGNAGLRSKLAGTLTAEARGSPAAGGRLASGMDWSAALSLDGARLGPLAFDRGEWRAKGSGPDAQLTGRLDVKGGAIALDADVHSEGASSTAGARLEVPFGVLPSLAGRDTLDAEGMLDLALHATGPLKDPRAMFASGRVRARGSVEGATLDSLWLTFSLQRGMVTLDTLAMRSNVVATRASGRFALTDPAEGEPPERTAHLHAEMELLDPSRLAPLLGADSLSVASGTLVLDVTGPARDREFALRSELRTLVWDNLRIKRAGVDARGRMGRAGLLKAEVRADADWVTLGGMRVPSARLRLVGDSHRIHWSGEGTMHDRDTVSLAGAFEPDSSGWTLMLERMDLLSDSTRWTLARASRLDVHGQRLALDGFEATSARGRILASGVLDRGGAQDFHVEVRGVGLGVLSALGSLGNVRGAMSGTLDVTGPAAEPRARGGLRATLHAGERPAGSLGANLDWTSAGFEFRSDFTSPERDSIVLAGTLPIAFTMVPPEPGAPSKSRIGGGHAEVRLRASRFPLRSLQPLLIASGVGAIDGMLEVDLRLTGRGTEFKGAGQAAVDGGRLELPGLGGKYSELRLQAAWNGDRLVLQELRALAGKGRLDANGSVRIASLVRAEPDLTVKADRAALVDTKELKLVASGDMHLGGTLTEPVLKGRMSFGGSHLLIAQETFADPAAKTAIPLSPDDLRMLEEKFTYVEPVTPDPLLGLYDASDLDLTILLDRNNWIRQTAEPRISVEVFGEVRMVKKPGGEPHLVGRLEPLPGRGYLEQFGRSFAFTGGEVLLNGPMASHTLNLRAQYPSERDAMSREENNVIVHLDLQGTLEKMRLVFSSEPPLSETEIITFIATGRSPTTRAGQSQDIGSDAVNLGVDMGMAMVSGALEDAAKGSVGLDVMKVGYDGVQGTTLIAGRYVAPQLYVGFRQPLQTVNNNGTNLDESTNTKVELEYAAYRWLVLNVQGESSFIRSYLRFRREY